MGYVGSKLTETPVCRENNIVKTIEQLCSQTAFSIVIELTKLSIFPFDIPHEKVPQVATVYRWINYRSGN
jgi:hypothetical protein